MNETARKSRQTRWIAAIYSGASLLLLIGVPVWRHFDAGHRSLWELPPTMVGEGSLPELDHRLLAAIDGLERGLEEGSPILDHALPWIQGLLTGLGGVGNEQVYLGREGWLVYRPGFDHLLGPPFLDLKVLERRRRATPGWQAPIEPDPRPALLDFAEQLERRGIRLLVMPVPTKLSIHPEILGGGRGGGAPFQNSSLATLLVELESSGIETFDPAPALFELADAEPAFLKSDSHWSPAAVDAVARRLAARLLELDPGLEGLAQRWIRQSSEIRGRGDLGRLLSLDRGGVASRHAVLEEAVEVAGVVDRGGRWWRSDRRGSVLLLGDSFTNVYSVAKLGWGQGAGLAEQLAFHLEAPIDRLAIQDGSATRVRRRLADELTSGRNRLRGKRWVVYQVAVRELSSGDWQRVELGAE